MFLKKKKKKNDFKNLFTKFELKRTLNEKIVLSTKKKEDVKLMLDKRWIPEKYRDFYVDILNF